MTESTRLQEETLESLLPQGSGQPDRSTVE